MNAYEARVRDTYAGRAEVFERTFGKLCAYPIPALLDATGVEGGQHVLDVGSGSGSVSVAALARGAAVTAVDSEPSMLELTRRNAAAAEVLHAALPRLPFADASFDVVVANFVVNHVSDPRATMAELRRVLRPGGRVGVTIWPYPQSPLHLLWSRVIEAAGVTPVPMAKLDEDKDFARTEAGLSGLLTEAKYDDVSCRTLDWVHHVDPETWWSGPAAGLAGIGRTITASPPHTVAKIKRHYDRLIPEFRTPTGELALPTTTLLATGGCQV